MRWRWVFLLVLLGGVVSVVAFPSLRNNIANIFSYSACDTPQQYKIGFIDPRFGLTRADVLGDIQQAVGIWNAAEGKILFTYAPNAMLSVNFVYDQRQALNSQIQQLNSNLGQTNTTLQQKMDTFKAEQAAFEKKLDAFNAQVNSYNSQGGAPPDVYKSLIQQQNALNSEADALNATAKQLNLSTSDYNAHVSSLNQDINQLNNELSQKPEEGLYSSVDDSITIYLTNSNAELIHTLVHEFGHALGMVHVTGAASLMYPQTSSSLMPTANDIQQLKLVCRQQSLILHEAILADEWFFTQIQNLQRGK